MTRHLLQKLAAALLAGGLIGLTVPVPGAQLAVLFLIFLALVIFAYFKSLWTHAIWLFAIVAMTIFGAYHVKLADERDQARWANLFGPVDGLAVRVLSDPYLENRAVVEIIDPPYTGLRMRLKLDGMSEKPAQARTIRVSGSAHGRNLTPTLWEPKGGWAQGPGLFEAVQMFGLAIRDRIDSAVLAASPPPSFLAFTRAELFGKRSGLDERTLRIFQENGLTHIIAVSGMHTSLLAAALFFVLLPTLGREAATAFTLAAVALFCSTVGLQPSVVRASLCTALALVGVMLDRHVRLLNILCAAFIIELIIFPDHLRNAGFQLSYLAVFAIAISADIVFLRERSGATVAGAARHLDRAVNSLLTLLLIQLFTAPITVYYFQRWSILSILSNLVFLPVFTALIACAAAGAVIAFVSPGLAAGAFWAGDYVLNASLACLEALPRITSLSSNYGELPGLALAAFTVAVAVFLMLAPKTPRAWLTGAAVFLVLFSVIPVIRHAGASVNISVGGDRLPFAAIQDGSRLTYVFVSRQTADPERHVAPLIRSWRQKGVRRIDCLDAPPSLRNIVAREFFLSDLPPPPGVTPRKDARGFFAELSGLNLLYWTPSEGVWAGKSHATGTGDWWVLEPERATAMPLDALPGTGLPAGVYIAGAIEPEPLKSVMARFEELGVGVVLAQRVDGELRIDPGRENQARYITALMEED